MFSWRAASSAPVTFRLVEKRLIMEPLSFLGLSPTTMVVCLDVLGTEWSLKFFHQSVGQPGPVFFNDTGLFRQNIVRFGLCWGLW